MNEWGTLAFIVHVCDKRRAGFIAKLGIARISSNLKEKRAFSMWP